MIDTRGMNTTKKLTVLPIISIGVLILLLLLTILPAEVHGSCSYSTSEKVTVTEGETASHWVRVRNDREPLGVKVKITIGQEIGNFTVTDTDHDLALGEEGYTLVEVFTEGVDIDSIITNFSASEKCAYDLDYHLTARGEMRTAIDHDDEDSLEEVGKAGEEGTIVGVTVICIILATLALGNQDRRKRTG